MPSDWKNCKIFKLFKGPSIDLSPEDSKIRVESRDNDTYIVIRYEKTQQHEVDIPCYQVRPIYCPRNPAAKRLAMDLVGNSTYSNICCLFGSNNDLNEFYDVLAPLVGEAPYKRATRPPRLPKRGVLGNRVVRRYSMYAPFASPEREDINCISSSPPRKRGAVVVRPLNNSRNNFTFPAVERQCQIQKHCEKIQKNRVNLELEQLQKDCSSCKSRLMENGNYASCGAVAEKTNEGNPSAAEHLVENEIISDNSSVRNIVAQCPSNNSQDSIAPISVIKQESKTPTRETDNITDKQNVDQPSHNKKDSSTKRLSGYASALKAVDDKLAWAAQLLNSTEDLTETRHLFKMISDAAQIFKAM